MACYCRGNLSLAHRPREEDTSLAKRYYLEEFGFFHVKWCTICTRRQIAYATPSDHGCWWRSQPALLNLGLFFSPEPCRHMGHLSELSGSAGPAQSHWTLPHTTPAILGVSCHLPGLNHLRASPGQWGESHCISSAASNAVNTDLVLLKGWDLWPPIWFAWLWRLTNFNDTWKSLAGILEVIWVQEQGEFHLVTPQMTFCHFVFNQGLNTLSRRHWTVFHTAAFPFPSIAARMYLRSPLQRSITLKIPLTRKPPWKKCVIHERHEEKSAGISLLLAPPPSPGGGRDKKLGIFIARWREFWRTPGS